MLVAGTRKHYLLGPLAWGPGPKGPNAKINSKQY